MSLDDVHIMMFYGSPENVNLTRSIKFITIKFYNYKSYRISVYHNLSIIASVYHQEAKTIEFIQCLIHFRETFQVRPNCVLKWHNTEHITVLLFLFIQTKCVALNT